ncbi:hypothetical protein SAY86_006221 [Trapa natans]|uniref:Rx N-terminal domain-containing protein n=1 Tax=Trapa natans TaxID=22666 RepID=A0AAN7KYF7_TRANT|nr:hypothetical protein SAY86_006221 [Trapa natans]
MADIAVSSALALLEIVSSFLQDEINLKNDVRADIARIRNWLDTMQAFLLDGEGEQRKAVFRDEQKQIRAFAYDIEDILDKFMFHVPHHFHRHLVSQVAHDGLYYFKQRSALKELSSEIQNIRKKLDDYITVAPLRMPRIPVEASSSETMYLNYSPYWNAEEDEIVGLKWHMEEILNQLLSDEPWITVAIVGPAGSGKTVLATKVFQDPRVRAAFKFLF